jgi:glycosyltransferase involved in cell wall biosynthesis
MNLLFDITTLLAPNKKISGIPRVLAELACGLAREKPKTSFVAFSEKTHSLFTFDPHWTLEYCRTALKNAKTPPETIEIHSAGKALSKLSEACLILPGNTWDSPEFCKYINQAATQDGVKTIPLIYDLIPFRFPQWFGPNLDLKFQSCIADALWHAQGVVTISETSKRDIQKISQETFLPLPQKIEVIRLGDALEVSNAPQDFEKPTRPFAICVGTIESRKNPELLYHLWRNLALKLGLDSLPTLVLIGGRGFGSTDTLYKIENDPLTKRHIKIIENVSDAALAWYYQNCLFSLYPSHYEGWGLPVAEALGFRKNTITSRGTSMEEISKDSLHLASSESLQEWLNLTEKLICDPDYRHNFETKIAANFKPTSWKESCKQFNDAIERILQS